MRDGRAREDRVERVRAGLLHTGLYGHDLVWVAAGGALQFHNEVVLEFDLDSLPPTLHEVVTVADVSAVPRAEFAEPAALDPEAAEDLLEDAILPTVAIHIAAIADQVGHPTLRLCAHE